MNKFILSSMVVAIAACNSPKQTNMSTTDSGAAKTASTNSGGEWIALFDGKSTAGWHTYGKSSIGKAWKVTDGALHLDASSKKDWQTEEGGDIITDQEFGNFDLKLEWKIAPKGNSGVIFYIHEDSTTYKYPWNTGPEMQVLDNGTDAVPGHPDAKIVSHRAGDLYDLIVSKEAVKPAGEWNQVEVVSNNGKLDFYMNGEHTLSTTMWDQAWKDKVAKSKFKDMAGFGTFKTGKIGLQDHGNDVWFRNIMIKKL